MTAMAVQSTTIRRESDVRVLVACAPEEHVFFVIETSEALSDSQLSYVNRRTAKALKNDSGSGMHYYESSNANLRPHVQVFLAVGTPQSCQQDAGRLQHELLAMANHPSHNP